MAPSPCSPAASRARVVALAMAKTSGEDVALLIETTEAWEQIAGENAVKDMLFGPPCPRVATRHALMTNV